MDEEQWTGSSGRGAVDGEQWTGSSGRVWVGVGVRQLTREARRTREAAPMPGSGVASWSRRLRPASKGSPAPGNSTDRDARDQFDEWVGVFDDFARVSGGVLIFVLLFEITKQFGRTVFWLEVTRIYPCVTR